MDSERHLQKCHYYSLILITYIMRYYPSSRVKSCINKIKEHSFHTLIPLIFAQRICAKMKGCVKRPIFAQLDA